MVRERKRKVVRVRKREVIKLKGKREGSGKASEMVRKE